MTDTSGTKSPSLPKMALAPAPVNEVDDEDENDTKREKLKEIPVMQDTGYFVHDTGDTYDGRFEIKKKDLSVKMHGPGVYTTAGGDIYSANWDNNIIDYKEPATVSYNDGAKFEGFLKDWCYTGKGKYTYPDGSVLTCDFAENCPVGNLTLTDPNGHIWLGKADQGFAWCSPVNHFYDLLETSFPRSKRRAKSSDPVPVPAPANRKGSAAVKSKPKKK